MSSLTKTLTPKSIGRFWSRFTKDSHIEVDVCDLNEISSSSHEVVSGVENCFEFYECELARKDQTIQTLTNKCEFLKEDLKTQKSELDERSDSLREAVTKINTLCATLDERENEMLDCKQQLQESERQMDLLQLDILSAQQAFHDYKVGLDSFLKKGHLQRSSARNSDFYVSYRIASNKCLSNFLSFRVGAYSREVACIIDSSL